MCFAVFQWSLEGDNVEVEGFTAGDISTLAITDPAIEDRVQFGNAVNARVDIAGPMRSGGATGRYVLPLRLPANSGGNIRLSVLPNSAYTVTTEMAEIHGPTQTTTGSFHLALELDQYQLRPNRKLILLFQMISHILTLQQQLHFDGQQI